MNIVVLNHYPVLPAATGGRMAVWGLARALGKSWPTSVVWTARRVSGSDKCSHEGLSVHPVKTTWIERRSIQLLSKLDSGIDSDFGSLLCGGGNRQLQQILLQLISDHDVLILCHPYLWPAVRTLRHRRNFTLVYDAHNIEHHLKGEKLRRGRLQRSLVTQLADSERDITQAADVILTCTQRDAEALQLLSNVGADRFVANAKGCEISPESRVIASARWRKDRPPIQRTAVFVGSDHAPNNEAARWIVESLAPQCPEWRFRIVGSCCHALSSVGGNVQAVGTVTELSAEFAMADIALNPVELGSGINIKLFDYLSHGLPVISTPHGARGFERDAERCMYVASRSEFRSGLEALRADASLYRRMSHAGFEIIEANYEWSAIGRRVADAIVHARNVRLQKR